VEFEDDESTDDDSEYNELDASEEEEWWKEDESEDLDHRTLKSTSIPPRRHGTKGEDSTLFD
jgi:hypothetical protein